MSGHLHPRLRNANHLKPKDWTPDHVYVGRPMQHGCPCKETGCWHYANLGNPFHRAAGADGVRLFHSMLADNAGLRERVVELCAAPFIIVCWCDGTDAVWCHGETYARLGDGEALEAITADVLGRFA